MRPQLQNQTKAAEFSIGEILSLKAFRPALRDMRFSIEERLDAHHMKELLVIAQDDRQKPNMRLLTRTRKGWVCRALETSDDVGDTPVIGVLGFSETIPYGAKVKKNDEAALALLLASNPKAAGIEQVGDSERVQTVWLGMENLHLIWKVSAARVKSIERLAGSAPVLRITHGLASVVRLAVEAFDPEKHSDVILCGDHSNFAWLDVISGRIQEVVRPRCCQAPDEFAEWIHENLSQVRMERTVSIHIWATEFCWLKDIPVLARPDERENGDGHPKASFTLSKVSTTDLIFA